MQVNSENVDSDVTEHLHQAYRLVHLFSALFQSFLSVPNHSTQLQPNLNTGSAGTGPRLKPSGGWRKAPALMVFTSTRVPLPSRSTCPFSYIWSLSVFQAVTFFSCLMSNSSFNSQALPKEVKENLMRRAILIMHNDLLVSQAVAELHKKKST